MVVKYVKGNSKEEKYKAFKLEQSLKKRFEQEKKAKKEKRKEEIGKAIKSKKMYYKPSNPLKGLLKSKGRTPNIQIKQGENVNLWR